MAKSSAGPIFQSSGAGIPQPGYCPPICWLYGARNRFFATVNPPAALAVTLVEVSHLYGPDFLIEIEAIAAA
jgi:hypothetical protein